MTPYTTCADDAAAIRAALKAKGWGRGRVSVRARSYSMGSSIDVEILDPTIRIADVRAIAETKERIDRDAYTGEILCGANRFVFVKYAHTAEHAMIDHWLPRVQAAVATVDGNSIMPIADTSYGVGNGPYGLSLWDLAAGCHVQAGDPGTLAYSIGARLGVSL